MLDVSEKVIGLVRGGKRVRGHCYIHVSLLPEQPEVVTATVYAACRCAGIDVSSFNVIRFSQVPHEITLLNYSQFFEDPFPSLVAAYSIDLLTKRVRCTDYSSRDNPPILHRKELLLHSEHPSRPKLAALTRDLEQRGVFSDSQRIGYRKFWHERLAKYGIEINDHCVVRVANPEPAIEANKEIARHRTAIVRDRLSAPMQALARHGLLIPERSVLDYGCGQGDDVRALQAGEIPVVGWDPHFAPDVPLRPADIVNLGFVLNVIEEPKERQQAVQRAFDLARQCLSVAVMIGKGEANGFGAYRDGVLTQRGTFQKYYRQEEIKTFLDATLNMEAIAVAPGVFFIFKDKILEQRFLLDRQRRIQFPLAPELRPPLDRPTLAERRLEALRPILERLWQRMFELGRPAVEEEISSELLEEIKDKIGSLRRAERLGSTPENLKQLVAAGEARKEDILVYFGLNLFNGRTRYSLLPPELQRDVKAFLGNVKHALEEGRVLLFSVGRAEVIDEACRKARANGLGHLIDGESLQLHRDLLNRLPPALRCYAGCAAKLYGDINTTDLIKIHVRSGKLTLLFYDDFDTSPLPRLRERVKIDMRRQRIDFFQHTNDMAPEFLFLKSRYLAPDQPNYDRQKRFDDTLVELGLFDFPEYGLSAEEFTSGLKKAGYAVRGFGLERIN